MKKAINPVLLKEFSKKMLKSRYEKKISQLHLAELSDCHVNTIFSIENCKSEPSLETSLKIAKVLNFSLDEMMDLVLNDLNI